MPSRPTDEATRILTLTSGFRPLPDNLLKLRKAIGQGGWPGLQDQGRFDFVEILVLHGWDAVEASPRCNALGPEFLAAPRANDQIWLPRCIFASLPGKLGVYGA